MNSEDYDDRINGEKMNLPDIGDIITTKRIGKDILINF